MAVAKKKKKFFDVEIPLVDKETQLLAYDISELNGKLIIYDLTRILKGKSMLLKLKTKVDKDKITTSPVEMKLLPYYLKRMVRKGTNCVEDSFSAECENAIIRIKPFLITRRKVPRAVRKALREKTKEELIRYSKNKKVEEIFEDIIKNKLQKSLSIKLKKVYPLSLYAIRILKIEKELEVSKKEKPKEPANIEEVEEFEEEFETGSSEE